MTDVNAKTLIGRKFPHPFKRLHPPCHVRGIVEDKIVVRTWSRSKQYWRYEVLDVSDMDLLKPQKPPPE